MNQFLKDEFQRLLDTIPETDPTTDEYHTLLNCIEHLAMLEELIDTLWDEITIVDVKVVLPQPVPHVCSEDCAGCDNCSSNCTGTASAGEDTQETEEQPEPQPEPPEVQPEQSESEESTEAAQTSEEETPAKTWDVVEVRRALAKAKREGVDLATIFGQVGASGMKDLKPEKYAEVMTILGAG